jgi:hypothetical protein
VTHLRIIATSIYVVTPWRLIYECTVIAILAFIAAVGLVATFEPLCDIAK